jgi:hypothetical protein
METSSRNGRRTREHGSWWLAATLSVSACAADDLGENLGAPVAGAPAAATPPSAAEGLTLSAVAAHGVTGTMVATPLLADVGAGRQHLIGVDWEIPGGAEQYLCARLVLPDDLYISEFYPLNPAGTHHTALTLREQPNAADGVSECDLSEVGNQNLGGSAAGTIGGQLPPGVAMKFARGSQLLLNLHLVNVHEHAIRGMSGAQVVSTVVEAVSVLADGVAAGPLKMTVPVGRSVVRSVCTVDHDYTVFSILPHMHQMGVHMKVVARQAGVDVLLHDAPFDFNEQTAHSLTPLSLKQGDTITVDCTYENTTAHVLHFGESTYDEMCIAGLARYPAGGKSACPY